MRTMILAAVMAVMITGPAAAYDEKGRMIVYGEASCGKWLEKKQACLAPKFWAIPD